MNNTLNKVSNTIDHASEFLMGITVMAVMVAGLIALVYHPIALFRAGNTVGGIIMTCFDALIFFAIACFAYCGIREGRRLKAEEAAA